MKGMIARQEATIITCIFMFDNNRSHFGRTNKVFNL
jgi:hypothetical protein